MQKGQIVKLKRGLYAAIGGGVAIGTNMGKHSEIDLAPTQNTNAVQFPINQGCEGKIVEVEPNALIVQLMIKEGYNLHNLYSFNQVNIRINKGAFGNFFEIK